MQAPKAVRLAEFFQRLGTAPPAASAVEAFELVSSVLNAVEDDLTDIPANPERWMTDGRMYPPQLDSRRDVPDHPAVTRYRSRRHNTFISANGAIEIRNITDQVIFRKSGADGKHVWKA